MPLLDSPSAQPEGIRSLMIEIYQPLVVQGLSLSILAQRAHWMVRGPAFKPLHDLFGDAYTLIAMTTDRLAERMVILGDRDPLADVSSVEAPTPKGTTNEALLESVKEALDAWCNRIVDAFTRAEEARLVADANALQSVTEDLEKMSWMVRGHLQR